ncbi:hypothetical protein [[Phormidium] sp. ETS-05]|uniref:hypothetical protein n=1 Tax=[Phormidium] sp. ETS-05 TaxID=222819 RepID=UPI0018EF3120|nr:hypothetical protein [[Phormidium] sp. ETS-05]
MLTPHLKAIGVRSSYNQGGLMENFPRYQGYSEPASTKKSPFALSHTHAANFFPAAPITFLFVIQLKVMEI